MLPLHRVHTTSYSSLIETVHLSCTVFEIQRVICRNSPTSTYPTCIWQPCWGWPHSNLKKIFGIRKLELGYRAALFAMVSHLRRSPTCDRHTGWHTDRHRALAYTAQSMALTVKAKSGKYANVLFLLIYLWHFSTLWGWFECVCSKSCRRRWKCHQRS